MTSTIPIYVREADQEKVVIAGANEELLHDLEDAQFQVNRIGSDEIVVKISSEKEKSRLFELLRNMGICFARGREWSPAEVFEWLRDKRELAGAFKEIYWTSPGAWHTREA